MEKSYKDLKREGPLMTPPWFFYDKNQILHLVFFLFKHTIKCDYLKDKSNFVWIEIWTHIRDRRMFMLFIKSTANKRSDRTCPTITKQIPN